MQRSAQRAHEIAVVQRGLSANAMLEMRGVKAHQAFVSQGDEQAKKRHRIGAAGDGAQHARARQAWPESAEDSRLLRHGTISFRFVREHSSSYYTTCRPQGNGRGLNHM